jgi:hypothetical protein
MDKQFTLPFRVGKKQDRAVLDAFGHEVVVFNKGLEYLALEYVNLMNEKLTEYTGEKSAGDIAIKYGTAVGTLGCPHCGVVTHGAIKSSKCGMCDKDLFILK